ncbi:MAG: hypothetical protein QHJ81_02340 [Anaerolineae bacterium]|nr:hypothetical protein [Anaerolineae bacterium]
MAKEEWERQLEEAEALVHRFAQWLVKEKRLSPEEASNHGFNAHVLADYLICYEGLTLETVSEQALKWFLYSHYIRKVMAPRETELALPRSIGLLYEYLHVLGRVSDLGWIQALCADEQRYRARWQGYQDLDVEDEEAFRRGFGKWINELRQEILVVKIPDDQAESLAVRKDMVTLLSYIRDHRVVATQARRSLPLKAVREINALFVNPQELDYQYSDGTVRTLRSEDEAERVSWLDIVARVGELLTVGRGRRIQLTEKGEAFLAADPRTQVWIMFDTWWYRVNWAIRYPFTGLDDYLPYHSEIVVYNRLMELPVGERIPFEPFADRLIAELGLTWKAEDTTFAQTALRGAIRAMVIDILELFEAAVLHYETRIRWGRPWRELAAFEITDFGHKLLESLG